MSPRFKDQERPAFPLSIVSDERTVAYHHGMSMRAYAAIQLRQPNSGLDWLDDMIRAAKRDDLAREALAGWLSSFGSDVAVKEDRCAAFAYRMADQMMAASEEQTND